MKKIYRKPVVEIETYELSASIAANCGAVISLGPEVPGLKAACDEFRDAFEVFVARPEIDLMNASGGTPFYTDVSGSNCTCYYSSGGGVYFTS